MNCLRSVYGVLSSNPHHGLSSFVIIITLMTSVLTAGPAHGASEGWTEWRGDMHHSAPGEGLSVPDKGELIWSFQTGDQVLSSPVFYDGGLLIGSDDGWLYCLDPGSGAMNWKFRTGGSIQATALVRDGKAYFGSFDGQFYCVSIPEPGNSAQPRLLWNFTCHDKVISSAHIHEGRVYFADISGTVHCLTTDGSWVWSEKVTGTDIWASPCLDPERGLLYIGDIGKGLHCLDMGTGKVMRSVTLTDRTELYSSAALANGGLYICTGEQKELLCLDPDDLSIVWKFRCGDPCYSTPNIKDGRVYFSSYRYLWCVPGTDPDNDGSISQEEVLWVADIHGFQGGSSPFVADGKVIVGSDDEDYRLFCFDATGGRELWNVSAKGYIYSSPSVFEGKVFFGSSDRSVYSAGTPPPGIKVTLGTRKTELPSNETLEIVIALKDGDGVPIEGAKVQFVLSAGAVSKDGLEPYRGTLSSDPDGTLEVWFMPPPVSSRSTVMVTVTASRPGLMNGTATLSIIVEPAEGTTRDKGLDYVDPQRPIYLAVFIGLLLVNAIILSALVGLMLLYRKVGREAQR